ncbi:nicotinate-nucleotide--dimethylbenzimidazole phosphoribosyltransferase [Mucilaginibacter sp. X4EP1]|uniref:nicotinate-nucleotide--dimethylbenzimidazole phosphoribosyltransferase n=1 Tax=Mucilaginibacter sp. X4EP1 TaxID=2723092 RepID=UPI0021689051|nr:nicotinate-nucleotide--dimethylbenzimidazole phosphoribosyltransferase [Mucilaginibacter sp. X4EP1]MCS3815336.1 nicotinate-nucleotide--dimethylbenzimidazole phosphoribosyltransferase [Mucilaginibacter sp. X4EP1]
MKDFKVKKIEKSLEKEIKHKIDFKTKPLGSLGKLEDIALQIGLIQETLSPQIKHPTVVVFAGDHGIANDGVSPYPQEVTYQMVMNFLNEGAGINVLAKQNGLALKVVDAGVNHDFGGADHLLHYKVNKGTRSFLNGAAMERIELGECFIKGAAIVNDLFEKGCNCIGFGEMGIGNTSSAAMLMHYFTEIDLHDCIGRGTGLDNKGLKKKTSILEAAVEFHDEIKDWEKIMYTFSGFEIAMMTGAMLQAAENKMVILLDGFIASAAYLAAWKLYPEIKDYVIACHLSDEKGHKLLLEHLGLAPLLNLGMRLGEGTGAAMAFPIVNAAVNFLNEMASFESAGVSNKE